MTSEHLLVTTEDGSLSRRDQETGELFHNRAGAITEARKNYIEPSGAIDQIKRSGSLTVLDACFGLGYNTWMLMDSVLESVDSIAHVKVLGVDRDTEVLTEVAPVLEDVRLERVRRLVAAASADGTPSLEFGRNYTWHSGATCFELTLVHGDLRLVVPELRESLDLVFHDPFSPVRVPELWTFDLFAHYYRLLKSNEGRLLTYSAAAAVRGGLREAGFSIWRTAAVGGKSGGTLALSGRSPDVANAFALSDEEELKVGARSGIPYRDPSLSATRVTILHNRAQEQIHSACPPLSRFTD